MVNNQQKVDEKNDNPLEFENVKVYASDSISDPAAAEIKNFIVCKYDSGDSLNVLNFVFEAHCLGFTKVFNHDTRGGVFSSQEDAANKNADDPDAYLFSILDQLENLFLEKMVLCLKT